VSWLSVDDLHVSFRTPRGTVRAVDGIGLSLGKGATLGLVGESGCGKSATATALVGLLPPQGRVSGSIRLDGRELVGSDPAGWSGIRGRRVSMVFQDPMSSLNPLLSVGSHLVETLHVHRKLSSREAAGLAEDWLARVGIPDPKARMKAYPHELSGGMRQRVMIALALCPEPELLLADEPTTALDVTIQAQILDLLSRLQAELGMAMVFITHDLGVVERVAERVAVMYAGRVVECGSASDIVTRPRHPYTIGLVGSVPGFRPRTGRLASIPGTVPPPDALPTGCRFHPRCDRADETCRVVPPPWSDPSEPSGPGHACHHPGGTG
jgi:peptide/nickel transport system ATP-binding protein